MSFMIKLLTLRTRSRIKATFPRLSSGRFRQWLVGFRNETLDERREDWRAHGFLTPAKNKFGGRAADTALASAHAETGLEFRVAPAAELAHSSQGNVFATADDRVVSRQRF